MWRDECPTHGCEGKPSDRHNHKPEAERGDAGKPKAKEATPSKRGGVTQHPKPRDRLIRKPKAERRDTTQAKGGRKVERPMQPNCEWHNQQSSILIPPQVQRVVADPSWKATTKSPHMPNN
jgi:hypothetical protein